MQKELAACIYGAVAVVLFAILGVAQTRPPNATEASSEQAKVANLFRRAPEGEAGSQVLWGALLYDSGKDVEAAAWIRKAADQGSAIAQAFLGRLYENGQGVPEDYAQAASLVTSGAIDGDAFRAAHGEIFATFSKGSCALQAVNPSSASTWKP